jgi:hypothetical protein
LVGRRTVARLAPRLPLVEGYFNLSVVGHDAVGDTITLVVPTNDETVVGLRPDKVAGLRISARTAAFDTFKHLPVVVVEGNAATAGTEPGVGRETEWLGAMRADLLARIREAGTGSTRLAAAGGGAVKGRTAITGVREKGLALDAG